MLLEKLVEISPHFLSNFMELIIKAREYFVHHPIFLIGILLVFGFALGKLSSKVSLPEITGFIITGLVLGPFVLGVISEHSAHSFEIVTQIALGFIALTIGGEFSIVKLKRLGKNVVIITLVQLVATFGAVSLGLLIFKMKLPFALMLGAIASATAPAATVAIVQSLRARGLFVDYLYGVVALDDAGCVILFGIIFSIAMSLLGGAAKAGIDFMMILLSFLKIIISIVLGAASGFLIHLFTRKRNNNNEIMIITLGFVFFISGVAVAFDIEPLLLNMAAGAVLINLSPKNNRIFRILKPITPPLYALFFILAGAHLDPTQIFKINILILGGIYILFRAIGKYGGVFLGCLMTKTDKSIRNYLGICMLPQAGVALALAMIIGNSSEIKSILPAFPGIDKIIINIVLLSIFFNELVGPPLSKLAIIKGLKMEDK